MKKPKLFIRKPEVIEAVRWFKHGDHPEVEHSGLREELGALDDVLVHPGDWIIDHGGFCVACCDREFHQIYQPYRPKPKTRTIKGWAQVVDNGRFVFLCRTKVGKYTVPAKIIVPLKTNTKKAKLELNDGFSRSH